MHTTGDWTGHYLRVGGARLVSVCKVRAEGQKASGDTESEGFAPRGQPLQSCTVHDAGALDLNDAAPAAPKSLSARTAAPRLAPRNPHLPLQPHAQPPQPAARSIISAQPAFASTRSQRSCPRYTQRTTEVQRRQLRHPSETRCQRRCPIVSDVIACTHSPAPRLAPRKPPPPATALRTSASALNGEWSTWEMGPGPL